MIQRGAEKPDEDGLLPSACSFHYLQVLLQSSYNFSHRHRSHIIRLQTGLPVLSFDLLRSDELRFQLLPLRWIPVWLWPFLCLYPDSLAFSVFLTVPSWWNYLDGEPWVIWFVCGCQSHRRRGNGSWSGSKSHRTCKVFMLGFWFRQRNSPELF